MRALENRVPPPLLVLIIAAAMWASVRGLPPLALDATVKLALASALILSGAALLILGFRAFGRAGTTINPVDIEAASALVTGGIFRFTRNPMYVGFTAMLVGWAVYLTIPWALLGPVAFLVFITRFQIMPEERVMASKFGDAYRRYRMRTRRWL